MECDGWLVYFDVWFVWLSWWFYDYLHILDNTDCIGIAVAPIPNKNLGETINDRLIRASLVT